MLDAAFRAHWSFVVAAVVGFCRDVDVAEEATAEAFAAAARRWAGDGPPDDPRAWLVVAARRRALDRMRRDRALRERLPLLVAGPQPEEIPSALLDERLELVLMCCHPALAPEARVALTLRAVGGLTVGEIARAFLVGEETMKRRLTRARTKIRVAGIPFSVPAGEVLPGRLSAVLAVLYLVFNQGWGDARVDLADEAIHLGRMLTDLVGDPRARALLALMVLHHSRRDARTVDGVLVPLADQDRARWDEDLLAEGRALLDRALADGARGPYALQAAIASLQTEDPIDWGQVVALHDRLRLEVPSPVVELDRAVAVAELDGPAAGLALVDGLDAALADHRYLHSTRAELLRRLGDPAAAQHAYDRALALATTEPERRFLARRRAEVDGAG